MLYIHKGGQQCGPYDNTTLRGLMANGTFLPTDLAWQDGMAAWMPLSQVLPPQTVPAFIAAAPAAPDYSRQQILFESRKKSPGLACFLNFIMPGLGYMYAGRIIIGLFVFACWLVCVCLFFLVIPAFIAGLIWLVGLIDGYLATERHNRLLAAELLGR